MASKYETEMIFTRLRRYVPLDLWNLLKEAVLDGEYTSAFKYMNRQYYIAAYTSIFEFIPDTKKYEQFVDAYMMPDIGLVNPEIIAKIFELRPKELAENLKQKADDEGCITLYRGESEKSTKLQRALSWTLNRDVAVWFAKRFNSSGIGCVYTANANISKVIAYITDREEDEILIRYRDIKNIKKEKIAMP